MTATALVATDGSDHATRALEVAADLCRSAETHLVLVHAVSSHEPSEAARLAVETEYAHELLERSRASLRGLTLPADDAMHAGAVLAHHRDVSRIVNSIVGENLLRGARERLAERGLEDVEAVLVEGDPAERVVALARARSADTVVLGCRGVGRVGSLLLGSVSQRVAHELDCRVVMVK